MSEKTQEIASDAVRAVLRAKNSTEAEAAIVAMIAAAEERGRRRGVELLREIQQLAEWAVDAVAAEAGRQGGDQLGREAAHAGRINLDRIRERVAALAPRVPHASEGPPCAGCGHPKWQHQYSSREAFCSEPIGLGYRQCKNYLAPRDSAPSADPAKVCDCGGAPSCAFGAPRDSGKGFSNANEPFAELVAAKARK